MTYHTHNEFHLGDNITHLNWLRELALGQAGHTFVHALHLCHREQLLPVVADVPNIKLVAWEDRAAESINAWKNADGFWERHAQRNDWVVFHLQWFEHLARKLGFTSPFTCSGDLLLNYPALAGGGATVQLFMEQQGISAEHPLDFLVVNSQPCSGQFLAYNDLEYLTPLIEELAARYRVVVTQEVKHHMKEYVIGHLPKAIPCTLAYGLSLTDIGTLSMYARHLIMVSTGPSWPTYNIWNATKQQTRILLLENERVNLLDTIHAGSREQVREILKAKELL